MCALFRAGYSFKVCIVCDAYTLKKWHVENEEEGKIVPKVSVFVGGRFPPGVHCENSQNKTVCFVKNVFIKKFIIYVPKLYVFHIQ